MAIDRIIDDKFIYDEGENLKVYASNDTLIKDCEFLVENMITQLPGLEHACDVNLSYPLMGGYFPAELIKNFLSIKGYDVEIFNFQSSRYRDGSYHGGEFYYTFEIPAERKRSLAERMASGVPTIGFDELTEDGITLNGLYGYMIGIRFMFSDLLPKGFDFKKDTQDIVDSLILYKGVVYAKQPMLNNYEINNLDFYAQFIPDLNNITPWLVLEYKPESNFSRFPVEKSIPALQH